MEKIFISPNSGEQNSEKFIKNEFGGYSFIDVRPFLSEQDTDHLKQFSDLYFWGNKPSSKAKWEKMQKGDWILFYSKRTIRSYGKLIYKTRNSKLAEAMWGFTKAENGGDVLWEYIFFYEKPKSSSIPFRILSSLAGYSENFVVQGLLPYKEEGTMNIINQFGGIDNFLSKNIPESFFSISNFIYSLNLSGFFFEEIVLSRFTASLLTKPFVILTGLSGSGKTKLAQAFVQWICQDESQYRIIPVGADWTNRDPLLGYPNALKPEEYVKPDSGVLDLIIHANSKPELPHFLILDEMNLSHVERYFADFLSVMESKEEISLFADGTVQKGAPAKLKIPSNLFIIGTVNIDETTNMFSPKVLDRANTIEFRVTKEEMEKFLGKIKDINMGALIGKGAGMAKSFLEMAASKEFATADVTKINEALVQFFVELRKIGAEFGYRSATEILRLINQLSVLDNTLTTNQKIDIAIIQKLLPKLHGSRRKLCPVLEILGSFCITGDIKIINDVFEKTDFDYSGVNVLYPLSLEKIARMYRGAIDNGFASFAEA
ncbi:MAG: hypothetical protein FJY17_06975 [Bacteroidetes bacterium]|nr:hypothetical protein [Bacteroidota bacterium]MBM3454933.1 hypothetical protein [Bacteroidota bacterium]